ncbi:hypothetical protein ANO14919_037900 [Xylariales sp. No.14919]|nr:hypothetical protein ANO14919_037900 [Xylariales sp. No.14919]
MRLDSSPEGVLTLAVLLPLEQLSRVSFHYDIKHRPLPSMQTSSTHSDLAEKMVDGFRILITEHCAKRSEVHCSRISDPRGLKDTKDI